MERILELDRRRRENGNRETNIQETRNGLSFFPAHVHLRRRRVEIFWNSFLMLSLYGGINFF